MRILKSLLFTSGAVNSSCFNGQNGGCSHFCNVGQTPQCSCPKCWELDGNQQTCSIAKEQATVTCSVDKVTIEIDKCAVPDVDPTKIHLEDASCYAVAEGDTKWKIESSSVAGCGAVATFDKDNDAIVLSNALHIGNRVVDGVKFGRSAKIGFTCNFRSTASASSKYSASNAQTTVSFAAGSVNEVLLDFPLELGFFKTNNYVDPIDSSQIAVGNTLYAQIHFPLLIPGMQFSIDTCSVSDKAIAGSNVDVVTNNCEIDGLDFGWTGESDSAVQFQFTSFIFPGSGETADMSMDCDVTICSMKDGNCSPECSPQEDEAGGYIVVLAPDHAVNTYRFSTINYASNDVSIEPTKYLDGSYDNRFSKKSVYAIVNGEFHVFGGESFNRKIYKLVGCQVVDTDIELKQQYEDMSTALAINNGAQALICADKGDGKKCELYSPSEETKLRYTKPLTFSHKYGRLGHYAGKPVIVGSGDTTGQGRIETFHGDVLETFWMYEWTTGPSWTTSEIFMPVEVHKHNLVDLESGGLLLLGGYDTQLGKQNLGIYLLKDGYWSNLGKLFAPHTWGSALKIGDYIWLFNGNQEWMTGKYPIQRVKIDETQLTSETEKMGDSTFSSHYPPIFEVSADFCPSV